MSAADTRPLVVVTGASSGIGQALAREAHRRGWRLALMARREATLRAWVAQQGWTAADAAVYAADVQDVASITAAGRACLAAQGLPQRVIANAGISLGVDTRHAEDLAVMEQVLRTNLLGVAATFQPFIGPMCDRGQGQLVGIASVAGVRGLPGHGAYCASKAGLIAYLESLRGECRPHGVQVQALLPGYVDTPLTRDNRYPMPFRLGADAFARRAWRVMDAGGAWRVVPWPMAVVARLMRQLPAALFDRLIAGQPRKHRHPGAHADAP
ncbi:SDR family oxidoreductase [Aquabacterium sp. J223]|uniref:SDR family oxidoreductase n=1 Tax=Aquabacterium sp. J223 TaxID=2898431 RepID=UPI0021AE120C|nr:SDR family oxidoreductase [Aquabacterium sp. J223]UUX96116.1 SDR family oxidoreductase [Aquabacterium sp. J223]